MELGCCLRCRTEIRVSNEKERERTAKGVDRAQAGSRYRNELGFVHRAPFISVVFFSRSDYEGSKLKIMPHIVGRQE